MTYTTSMDRSLARPIRAMLLLLAMVASNSHAFCNSTPNLGQLTLDERNLVQLVCTLDAAVNLSRAELADLAALIRASNDRTAALASLRTLLPALVRAEHTRNVGFNRRDQPHLQQPRTAKPARPTSVGQAPIVWFSLAEQEPTNAVWLQLTTDRAEQEDTDGLSGYEAKGTGLQLGIERHLTDRWSVGLSASAATTDVESNLTGKDDLSSTGVATYVDWSTGASTISFSAGYNRSDNDRLRIIRINTDAGTRRFNLRSDVSSNAWHASLGWSSFHWFLNGLSVSPYIDLEYSALETDQYRENGGGELSLIVETDDIESVLASAGVSIGYAWFAGDWMIAPDLSITYQHELAGDNTVTLSRLANVGRTFRSEGIDVQANRWLISTGVSAHWGDNISLFLTYATERRTDYKQQAASVGLQVLF